jgi:NAD(P)-dependent dehydrogenase (short-subunit alcohol dehydrogenase family)
MKSLRGKVALVTGAGGDASGRAISRRFAREGAAVVVSDINIPGGRETVRMIESDGGRAVFIHADVRRELQVRNLVERIREGFGRLDILVNNASGKIVPEATMDDWFRNIEVDFIGAMYCLRHAIDAMSRNRPRGGAIVNIGSTSSLGYGPPHSSLPGYDAAKAAMMHISASLLPLAREAGIRVNCLVPDWIASQDVLGGIKGLTPAQRRDWRVPPVLTTPDEIAEAALGLATDKTLAGRVLVWWSGKKPGLLPLSERGYTKIERF